MAQPACLSAMTMSAQIPLYPPLPKGEKAGPVSSPFLSPAGLDGRFAPLARCGNRNRASRHPCAEDCCPSFTRGKPAGLPFVLSAKTHTTLLHIKTEASARTPQSIRRLDRMDLELIGSMRHH